MEIKSKLHDIFLCHTRPDFGKMNYEQFKDALGDILCIYLNERIKEVKEEINERPRGNWYNGAKWALKRLKQIW